MRIPLAALVAALAFGQAGAVTTIRTAAQTESEPKYLPAEDGKGIRGLCVDLYRAIEQADPNLRFVGDQAALPLKRLETMVERGELDAFCGLVRNAEREARFVYAEPALYNVAYRVAIRADDRVSVAGWDDVRKLGADGILLVNQGSGAVKRLEEFGGLKIDAGGRTTGENLSKLLAGRGRFYYYRTPGLKGEIRRAGLADKIRILPATLDVTPFYLLFNKAVPRATVEAVNRALAQLQARGELARILDRWDDE
ncbi:substrate-binding periplasmic protein [Chitinimonas koreensis]|uniref:substrate-binding periplasmic protein n=1 Tax=Chitinimonas koreensis TaxID=356302 RepID=UPI00040F36C5|nr:transporter substrate-binding domain-containing protein [Chitinimonas koreensis]QNM96072.1 transporter substrate-binding domain-containing protein [Chitinimonas koreensis]